MLDRSSYPLNCTDRLLSPCLLLYRPHVEHNLAEMLRMAGGDPLRLRPHAKTHKTGDVIRMELDRGIVKHKCATLQEARMLADHGASDVLLAYPLVGPNMAALVELLKLFPETQFSVVADNCHSVGALERALAIGGTQSSGLPLRVFIDVDTGMHRTGVQPGPLALAVAQAIDQSPSLTLAGLHLYDGQNHQPSLAERQAAVAELLQPVWELIRQMNASGISVDRLVCGGTPTFPVFAALEVPADLLGSNALFIELSPGTCVLQDFNYGRDYTDMAGFRAAAVLLCRVVSKPGPDLLTVDLGYKAVAPDSPAGRRAYFIDIPGVEQIQHSEEHLVLKTPMADQFELGSSLLAIPAHVCPTVALHSHFHVIDQQGELEAVWPITRERMLAAGRS